ncbi:MAG: oligosaccharide flippase family protein [Bacteroidetes bacterium]|nr:oligosaccharide flippase family protein [Bacteroidota bacterium]
MQKKFVTNLALLLFLNLLIKPFWILGIDRSVQNAVGAADYGMYFALFNFSFLLNIILDFGITNFNNKNIAQNNHLLTKHFSSIVVLKIILAVIYLIITIISGFVIGYDVKLTKMLILLAFNQFLISFIMYLRSNLAGLHLFKTDSFVSILDRLIMIAICGVLLWGNVFDVQFDIIWFVYSQTAAYFFTALITFIIVVRKVDSLQLKWSFPFSLMILKKSFPFAVLVLLMTFYNRIDAVMLERILPDGEEQSGIYAQAYRLLDATNMIAFLFAGMLLPIFSRMIKYKESVEQLVKLCFTLLITLSVMVAVCCAFYSEEFMHLLYKQHIELSSPVFAILMCCFIATSTTYVFGTLLTANGNLKELNTIAASGMVVNIALNFLLIPVYKATGSAMSSLFTQVATGLAQVLMVQYQFRFNINYRLLSKLAVYVFGVICINYFSKMMTEQWMLNFVASAVGCVVWAFLIRLINIKSAIRILKYG